MRHGYIGCLPYKKNLPIHQHQLTNQSFVLSHYLWTTVYFYFYSIAQTIKQNDVLFISFTWSSLAIHFCFEKYNPFPGFLVFSNSLFDCNSSKILIISWFVTMKLYDSIHFPQELTNVLLMLSDMLKINWQNLCLDSKPTFSSLGEKERNNPILRKKTKWIWIYDGERRWYEATLYSTT